MQNSQPLVDSKKSDNKYKYDNKSGNRYTEYSDSDYDYDDDDSSQEFDVELRYDIDKYNKLRKSIALSANLMKLLGVDVSKVESSLKTDWKPPVKPGLLKYTYTYTYTYAFGHTILSFYIQTYSFSL